MRKRVIAEKGPELFLPTHGVVKVSKALVESTPEAQREAVESHVRALRYAQGFQAGSARSFWRGVSLGSLLTVLLIVTIDSLWPSLFSWLWQ